MTNRQLIAKLQEMPLDLEVGSTNYYGDFGTATDVVIEKSRGKDVVVVNFDLDLQ